MKEKNKKKSEWKEKWRKKKWFKINKLFFRETCVLGPWFIKYGN